MVIVNINEFSFESTYHANTQEMVLRNKEETITIHEVDDPCVELRSGSVPAKVLEFLALFLRKRTAYLDTARNATARQMWEEYAGGWRDAGDTNELDQVAFGAALGAAKLAIDIDQDGRPCRVELWWQNTALFLGHSVFVEIRDPANWDSFEASIFG